MNNAETKSWNVKTIELVVYLVVWLGIFSIPFFQNNQSNTVDWQKAGFEWIRMSSFLLVFTLNAFLFVPKLLFQKKYWGYFAFSLLSVVGLLGITLLSQFWVHALEPLSMPPMNLGPGMPPMELGNKMPAPMGYKPPLLPEQKSVYMILAENFIISLLLIGASTAIKMVSKWLDEENRRKDLEKEQLKTELALLRHQVSPHFFMNTLNNIHALVDIDTEKAKDAIIRLSTLMRYLLYETAQGHTGLKKEVSFIESYFSLMKLRYSNKMKISIEIPENIPDIQIPPMLFISFIENAFKHGVSYQNESFVNFKLELSDNSLSCTLKNSKHKNTGLQEKMYSGIGLANIRKSLALLFGNDYTFDILENDQEFEVKLIIPVYENKMHSH
ncbi:MAG TPA: histidine kinase [Paludibacter sp.]|nr:histidine kinase [Paludibacter sp.]